MFMSRCVRLTWRICATLPKVLLLSGKEAVETSQLQTPVVAKCITSATNHHQQIGDTVKIATQNGEVGVIEGTVNLKTVEVLFEDKSKSLYPHVWLRENCHCPKCFNKDAIARLFLIEELDLDIEPKNIQVEDGGLRVEWKDGHSSFFAGDWLRQRSFSEEARAKYRTRQSVPRVHWGSDFKIPEMDFQTVMTDDKALLDWLLLFEKYGLALLKNTPTKVGPLREFLLKIGFMKPTHYGMTGYELITTNTPNNLAYTGSRLGLHTDMPYLDFSPGTVWLHCLQQHTGEGGDNDISDGFNAASILREKDPALFEFLTKSSIYFQDKGNATYDFDKITRAATIVLDEEGNLQRLNISPQSRDSMMDLDPEGVLHFYKALKTLQNILLENKINYKTQPGDIIAMDNMRLVHGRTEFDPRTSKHSRHLDSSYIDWSELRSKRRVLQNKLGIELN